MIKLNYELIGDGKTNIIYLHGWQMDLNSFRNVINKNRRNYLIDLPGFGKSLLDRAYSLDDYVYQLRKFIIEKSIDNPIIVGHSFGGRIAMRYAKYYDVKGLILVDSAGIKLINLRVKLKRFIYKMFKAINIKLNMGSNDYKMANELLKGVLKNVCNTDQKYDLEHIKCPTLVVYGKKDKVTPIKMAKIIKNGIKASGLVIIPKAGHFPHLEKPNYYYRIQESFIGDIE